MQAKQGYAAEPQLAETTQIIVHVVHDELDDTKKETNSVPSQP